MYHLTAGEPVATGVRAVAKDQLDRALGYIDDEDVGGHESVHDSRKRCKKVRALLRLVRDDVPETYRATNTELRDIARLVADERDAAAHVEAHDLLADELGEEVLAPYGDVRAALVARRDGAVLERIHQRLPEVRERLATVRWNVDGWELPDGDAVGVLRQGYQRTYRRARKRWQEAVEQPSSHVWHEWRKRVKYNRYHTNLLQQAWPSVMELREDLCHDLTDHLGDDHDLAELREAVVDGDLVEADGDLLTGYVGLLDGVRTQLQHRALPLAARLYGQPTDEHCDMVLAWWQLATDEAHDAAVETDELTPIVPHGH